MTNADKIRKMKDVEIAAFLGDFNACYRCVFDYPCEIDSLSLKCKSGILRWLQQEAEDEQTD